MLEICTYVHKREELQKYVARHLRDLSLLAILPVEVESVESMSSMLSDKLSYVALGANRLLEPISNQFPLDASFDERSANVPELLEIFDCEFIPKNVKCRT
jgi:hypothetical protein